MQGRVRKALISAQELAEALSREGRDRPVVLDVRWRLGGPPGREEYLAGHIPGAVFVDLDAELAAPPGSGDRGRHPLPEADEFERAMRRAGVSGERPVVVYDAGGASGAAARAWWTLRYFGHRCGGGAWTAASPRGSGPVERGEPVAPTPAPGDFVARPGGMPVLDADGAGALAAGEGVLLDARAAERYRGEVEPVDPVAGHIPGAVNAPASRERHARRRIQGTE